MLLRELLLTVAAELAVADCCACSPECAVVNKLLLVKIGHVFILH